MKKTKKSIVHSACKGKGGPIADTLRNYNTNRLQKNVDEAKANFDPTKHETMDYFKEGDNDLMDTENTRYHNERMGRKYDSAVKAKAEWDAKPNRGELGFAKDAVKNVANTFVAPVSLAAKGIGAVVKGVTGKTPKDIVKGAIGKVQNYRKESYARDAKVEADKKKKWEDGIDNPDNYRKI